MLQHDQTENRHIINVPIPFTKEGLYMLIQTCHGFNDELTQNFVDAIIEEKETTLNPSDALGECTIQDMFALGFMAYMKVHFNLDVPIKELWFHPMSHTLITKIKQIEVEFTEVELIHDSRVITTALYIPTDQAPPTSETPLSSEVE